MQVFAYTKRQQIMSDDNCLDATGQTSPVKLVRCHGMGGNQAWNYNEEVIIIMTRLQSGRGDIVKIYNITNINFHTAI